MKKIITFLFSIVLFTSCSSDDDDKQNPVVGKWKMVKIETLVHITNTKSSEDVSNQNITYTFDRRSNLTINKNGQIESYKYQYKIDYLGGGMPGEPKTSFVIVNDAKWTYQIVDGKMVLGSSYVDGSDYFFEKQ
ncbi:hypothetical protein ACFSJW_21590 [Flavobacterium artemisiae]|uniref:Lipocalin-like domain-containing protein n=1 Tax=Flavobacterium artemisiae TaxID=2126556 RepID=A0ABW4HAT0_9FLAO